MNTSELFSTAKNQQGIHHVVTTWLLMNMDESTGIISIKEDASGIFSLYRNASNFYTIWKEDIMGLIKLKGLSVKSVLMKAAGIDNLEKSLSIWAINVIIDDLFEESDSHLLPAPRQA